MRSWEVKGWYFVVVNKQGKEQIVAYGDSRTCTEKHAFARMKELYPGCRIATKEDMNRLL